MTLSDAVRVARTNLAANIRHHRLRLGLTRGEFAQRMRVNIRNLEEAEDPRGANLSLVSLIKFSHALAVDPADLFMPRDLPELKRGLAAAQQLKQQRKTT